jgi:hypothetical protein
MSIYKRVRDGKASNFYYYKFEYQGKVIRKCAETANKYEAMAREREARTHAREGRWAEIRKMGMRQSGDAARMADVLTVYRNRAPVTPTTKRQNISCLRTVCATLYKNELEELSTADMTAKLVREYKAAAIAGAGQDKVALESAKITANSTYGQARSLFSDAMLICYEDNNLHLGDNIAEFRTVPLFEVARRQYKRPSLELLIQLLKMAFVGEGDIKSLRDTDPNAYKAFLLCLGLGLRKAGASHARYSWITQQKSAPIAQLMLAFRAKAPAAGQAAATPAVPVSSDDANPSPATDQAAAIPVIQEKVQRVLLIQIEEDFQPKGKDETCIPMDEFVFTELEALRVANSDVKAPSYILHGNFSERTELVWRRLSAWMLSLGWERRMKAHELRKLYGSEVATAFGLYAAQQLLGHKDANITSDRYAALTNLPDVRIFG